MTRSEYRLLLWGVGLLGGGTLLLELFTFRLAAAAIGHGFAIFAAITAPAVASFGAMVLARRGALRTGHQLDRTTAHLAGFAGSFAVFGVIGLTLVSQKVAKARGDAELWHVVVAVLSCWLPALFAGGAVGTAMRRGIRRVGRFGFATAGGAVVACMALPTLMMLGAPRAAILNGLIFGAGALLFAYAGRSAKPRTPVIWTLPLAVLSLIAGDVGAPWLKMRFDLGRRTRIAHTSWSAQGLIAVQKVKSKRTNMTIDRHEHIPLAENLKPKRKPTFRAADLVYLTSGGEKGPVLVIGSGGGREVTVGLAYEHPRVDAVELHGAFVNELLLDEYAALTGYLFFRKDVVKAQISDGRSGIDAMPSDYQHVVVVAEGRFDQAAPRLVSRPERLYTHEAIASYLARLREDGSLLLRAPTSGLPGLVASAIVAMGGDTDTARDRMLACGDEKISVLLVQKQEINSARLHNLRKRCKRSRLNVQYPLKAPERREREHEKREAERKAKLAVIAAATPATDDRPFLVAAPPFGALKAEAWASLRALESSRPEPKKPTPAKEGAPAKPEAGGPVMTKPGIAAGATAVALLWLLLGLLVPAPRSQDETGGVKAPAPLPGTLRWSFPFLGIALAVASFVLHDALVRVAGDAAYAWGLILPLGLVGVSAGRLWVDAMVVERLRSSMMVGLGVGLLWLVVLTASGGAIIGLASASSALKLSACMFLAVINGALLGWPLAAGLRAVAAWDRAPTTWCWGAHLGGWAVGGGLATLLVRYLGVSKLAVVAVAAFALGAMLLAAGLRKEPPHRWFVRQVG